MKNITIKHVKDAIERTLFGATAEEAAAARIAYIDSRIELALNRLAASLAQDEDDEDDEDEQDEQ